MRSLLLYCLLLCAQLPISCIAQTTVAVPVSSLSYRGASLQVMQYGSQRFVEPFIALAQDTCVPGPAFDYLASRYALRLPLTLEAAGLPGAAAFTPAQLEPAIAGSAGASVPYVTAVDCRLDRTTNATLTLWCDTFDRCQLVRAALAGSPKALAASLTLTVRGVVAGQGDLVSLSGRQLQLLPAASPGGCGTGWILFQQRVDGGLSFQQNWDTYVRGFGSPDSNYWMGLERISAETLNSLGRGNCSLRVEVVDVYGTFYFAEAYGFQVLPVAYTYSFFEPNSATSSTLRSDIFVCHHGMPFLTFDRDSTTYCGSGCSKTYGYSGWWFSGSFRFNLNGLYTNRYVSNSQNGYNQATAATGTILDLRTSRMLYKCLY